MIRTKPSVAAVIPCYNVEPYVEECLQSVLDQRVPFTEVVLIDDGSSDGTYDVLKRYGNYAGVILRRLPRNTGLGTARNIGVLLTQSQFVCFIDADDLVSNNLVSSFLETKKANPLLDLYCFSANNFSEGGADTAQDGFLYVRSFYGTGKETFSQLVRNHAFFSCPVLFITDKKLINWKRSGFRNILHEDEELTPRLFLQAQYVVVDPAVLYNRRLRAGSITASQPTIESLKGCCVAGLMMASLYLRHLGEPALRRALGARLAYLIRIILGRAKWFLLSLSVRWWSLAQHRS